MAPKAGMMYWQAMRVDPWFDHEALRAAFADVFPLDPSRIEITDYPELLTGPIPSEPRIHLERVARVEPFPLQLSVFLIGDELEQPVANLTGTLDKARALARRLGATLLFGDGPIGYSEQLRVAPDGTVDVVQLDWDDEDGDRFVILGARPFVEQPAEPAQAHAG
jgi:hypothetical protein